VVVRRPAVAAGVGVVAVSAALSDPELDEIPAA
jgi:hypothetical protein